MAGTKEPVSADMQEIGEHIKTYRKKKGLTLEGLAEDLGGTYSAKILSQYEHGCINIGARALLDLSWELGVTPNQLFPGWIVEEGQDEAVNDFMLLNEGNRKIVRDLIKGLLENQKN